MSQKLLAWLGCKGPCRKKRRLHYGTITNSPLNLIYYIPPALVLVDEFGVGYSTIAILLQHSTTLVYWLAYRLGNPFHWKSYCLL